MPSPTPVVILSVENKSNEQGFKSQQAIITPTGPTNNGCIVYSRDDGASFKMGSQGPLVPNMFLKSLLQMSDSLSNHEDNLFYKHYFEASWEQLKKAKCAL